MKTKYRKEIQDEFKRIQGIIKDKPIKFEVKRYISDIEKHHQKWAEAKNAQERWAVMFDGGSLAGLLRMNLKMNTFTDLEKEVMQITLKHLVEVVKNQNEEHKELTSLEEQIAKAKKDAPDATEVITGKKLFNQQIKEQKATKALVDVDTKIKAADFKAPAIDDKTAKKKKLAEEMGFTGKLNDEQDALLDILADDKATDAEKEYARRIFANDETLEIANDGNSASSKFVGVPSKYATEAEKELYSLRKDGFHKVDTDTEEGVYYKKTNDNLTYKASGKEDIDRAVVKKMLEHAQKLGFDPITISGSDNMVNLASQICDKKGINYQVQTSAPSAARAR